MPRLTLAPRPDLYLCAHTPWKHHDRVVTDWVAPVIRAVADAPQAESFFFVRMNVPTWQVRLRMVGERSWLDGPYRRLAEEHAEPLLEEGVVETLEATHYERELERYGGERGMELAEALYSADTRACLEWIALERRDRLARSRRELALLTGELYADLLGLTGYDRGDFYHCGYRWALQTEAWGTEDLQRLEERYRQLEPALIQLLGPARSPDGTELFLPPRWGGEAAATVAESLAREIRPRLTEVLRHRAELPHLSYLAWSYTHLLCNRLGLPPAAEAVVRYLGHRFHTEHRGVPEPASYPLPPVPETESG